MARGSASHSGEVGVDALRGVDLAVGRGSSWRSWVRPGRARRRCCRSSAAWRPPTAGQYRLAGEDVARFDERKAARVRRERIGFVFQGFNLLPRDHGAAERRAAAGLRPGRPRASGASVPGRRWRSVGLADRAGAPAQPAVRRPAATGRGGPGDGDQPARRARRRAHRQPRLAAARTRSWTCWRRCTRAARPS